VAAVKLIGLPGMLAGMRRRQRGNVLGLWSRWSGGRGMKIWECSTSSTQTSRETRPERKSFTRIVLDISCKYYILFWNQIWRALKSSKR
jgi:hypothetical protein